MFTAKDLSQISSHGLTPESVNRQIDYFKQGFPFLNIVRAAVIGDGILRLTPGEIEQQQIAYRNLKEGLTVVKFVPASGAATRMFKECFEYVNDGKECKNMTEVLAHIDCFAFGKVLRDLLNGSNDPKETLSKIIKEGLGYGKAPKGLILFHKYDEGNRTALEEHLVEGARYAASGDNSVNIHFTVSPEHQAGFEALIGSVLPKYEAKYGVKYNISYSQQKSGTDTIAVTPENEPFREADGSLLFRPAGHGALLENLNDIEADLIFIKTIDNVAPDHLKPDTIRYKEVIAGVMLSLQERCFHYLHALDATPDNEALLTEIETFITDNLCYKLPASFAVKPAKERATELYALLNRPIRVCGMVKNEGEPGGGPFWTTDTQGALSLQIAESSQIAPEKRELMAKATHFNPVDLVCGVKDYKGRKFDLSAYVDPLTGFISLKSKDGRELQAQELPGLWNGAMSNWNTLFVEVPITTFSPVKTINDLLRPQHQ